MKLSLAIASEKALPSAFVVYRDKLEHSIEKAAELGYHGIELALLNRDQVDLSSVKKTLEKNNMEVAVVSTGQVFAEGGMWFTAEDEAVRNRAMKQFSDLMDVAAEFQADINIGRLRGFVADNQTREQAEKNFLVCLKPLAEKAEKLNINILVEPVNRYEINYINSCREGIELLQKLNNPRVKLMPDVFHMNIEDPNILEVFAKWIDYIGYIHFADSNRHAPGMGHLDFRSIVAVLQASGYDGYVGIEILPFPEPDAAAKQAAEYVLPLIKQYEEELAL